MACLVKKYVNAGVAAVAIIVLIESLLNGPLHRRFVSHEVDETLQRIETRVFDSPVVVLGDSVGHGIFKRWKHAPDAFAFLACNHATEAAGQYFFLRRYLKRNRLPGSVIVADLQPMQGNLEYKVTENFVQRCFTNWEEIGELFWAKLNPEFTLKMIAYKLLPTFKFRLHVQKNLVNFSNAEIYRGDTLARKEQGQMQHGLFRVLGRLKQKHHSKSIAARYTRRMIDLLAQKKIPYYYYPPPTNAENAKIVAHTLKQLKPLTMEFDNLEILAELSDVYSTDLFRDDVHLNEAGLEKCHRAIKKRMTRIVQAAREIQQENIFRFSQKLLSLSTKEALSAVTIIKDLEIDAAAENYTLLANGAEPTLRLPAIQNPGGRKVVYRICLDSPRETVAKVYYKKDPAAGFSERHSLEKPMVKGFNALYYVIPPLAAATGIRFDPGEVTGRYVLYSVEARVL